VTRRFSRIRSTAALALAVAAVAAPAAVADGPAFHRGVAVTARSAPLVGDPVGDRVQPAVDTQVVGDPVGDRLRPGASVVLTAPNAPATAPLVQADEFDWLDAAIGAGALAMLLLVGVGATKSVRTRRSLVRAA
jgi:hypothetical protein